MSDGVLIIVLTLAAYRLWRLLAKDDWPPVVWFRDRFDERFDGSFVADGFYCPWCLGSWLAAVTVAWADYLEGIALPVFVWFAVATLVGLVGSQLDD